MKLIFLATLIVLAAEWPTPTVCWPAMNQQFGDTSSLSTILGQQMLSNQMNGYGMNTMMGNGGGLGRFNPDLMQAFGNDQQQQQQRAAFSRLGNQAKAKKLSNTKFMLKPTVLVDDAPMEEAIEKFEQELAPTPQSVKQVQKEIKPVETVVKHEEERPTAKVEEQQKQEVKQTESKEAVVSSSAKQTNEAKPTDGLLQKIQEQVQHDKIESKVAAAAAAEKQAEVSAANNDHPAVKAMQEPELAEFHAPAHVNYQEPFSTETISSSTSSAPPSESVRLLNGRQMRMQQQMTQQQQQQQLAQQQQQQAFDQYYESKFQQPQQQLSQQQAGAQVKPLKFKLGHADEVNSVGLDTIRNEMTRVLSQRKNNKTDDSNDDNGYNTNGYAPRPSYLNSPYYQPNLYGNGFGNRNYAGYVAPVPVPAPAPAPAPAADQLSQAFSSLIIIVNSNENSNLGVNIIDIDLFRSFLSQYASKSVNEVLRDSSLEERIKEFNREREKAAMAGKSDKSSSSKSSDKSYKGESTTKLSANVPSYSGEEPSPNDSHSESTVLLRKSGPYGSSDSSDNSYNDSNSGSGHPYEYSYVPYQKGALIVINNENDNYNKVVKSVLSGRGKSLNKNDAFVLPLPSKEIRRLMKDAVIVNNHNKNTNHH